MTLPLSPEEHWDYNNVPTTPLTQKLGDTIDELYARIGLEQPFGEIYGASEKFVRQDKISNTYVRLDVFDKDGLHAKTVTAKRPTITIPFGTWRVYFEVNEVRRAPLSAFSIFLAFGLNGNIVTPNRVVSAVGSVNMSALVNVDKDPMTLEIYVKNSTGEDVSIEFLTPRLQAFCLSAKLSP